MKTVGRLFAVCRPTVGRLLANCRPTIGRPSVDSWSTIGRQTANSRPTVLLLCCRLKCGSAVVKEEHENPCEHSEEDERVIEFDSNHSNEGLTLETSAFYSLRWLIYVFNPVVNTKLPAVPKRYRQPSVGQLSAIVHFYRKLGAQADWFLIIISRSILNISYTNTEIRYV